MAKINTTSTAAIEDETTGLGEGAPNAAADAPAATDEAAPADGTKPISAYKKRLMEKGLDAVPVEAPQELVDMCRAAAGLAGDISLAAWVRQALARQVNSLELKHTVDGAEKEWKFDLARLDASPARSSSTRGLTEEQKAKKIEEKKQTDKEEREYVKNLLARHRAALKGGDPQAQKLEEEAKAAAAAALTAASATGK